VQRAYVWAEEEGILAEIKLFSRALSAILTAYPEDLNPRVMLYAGVSGMLNVLDKYSEFIDPDKYELLKIGMRGEYAGIGIILEEVQGFPGVRGVKPDSVAQAAGILAGDIIQKLDGASVRDMPISEVASLLRGEANTPITLTILRSRTREVLDITVVREVIEIAAVKDTKMVGRAIGFMRVSDFSEHTGDQVDNILSELQTLGMEALIIDLRGNEGGLLPAAVSLSERFLPAGTRIVTVRSKVKEQRKEYFTEKQDPYLELPLVVLVDEKSASSSEIFSAAIQENGRGRIVGTVTYGKGSVQSVVPLDDDSAMKLTTARYLTSHGNMIDGIGVEPDFLVATDASVGAMGDAQMLKAIELLKQYF